ncbi:hypothetical protein MKX01_031053 [Papaver californicum]|nr:hypothetical protein MKX01_031053 [Papaver californicum]
MALTKQQEEKKQGDARIYLVSCVLFFCIVAGGVFLALYIHLPESESSAWYPAAGMILVGIPWIFWLLTLIYSCLKKLVLGSINSDKNNNNNNNNKVAPVVSNGNGGRTSGASTFTRSSTESNPGAGNGGAGHVRFGGATVVGDEEDDNHDDGVDSVDDNDRDSDLDREGDGGLSSRIGPTRSSSSNGEGSSLSVGSHESELPLAFSM